MTQMLNQYAKQYADNYIETAITEATPHKLVDMLYEGLLKNLYLVKAFIEQKNIEKKAEAVNKSMAILSSLRAELDLEKGGQVAENLYGLYDFSYRHVFQASAKNQAEMVDEVIDVIKPLREAWNDMPANIKKASHDQLARL